MKRIQATLFAVATILFVIVGSIQIGSVSAAGGLTLSPPLKEITLSPGLLQTTFDVMLKNTTGSTVNASYKLVDLRSLGQYGGNTLDKAGLPDSYNLANWMRLAGSDTQRINNGETATINVTIENREDLSPGGHYGAVIITTSPEGNQRETVNLNQQIISLVFVKKLGGETYGLGLESLKPNKPSDIPDSVDLNFKSTGNVHVTPRGYVEVTDPKGLVVAKGIINPDSSIVLPGASRKLISMLQPVNDSSQRGQYTITAYYRYDGEDKFSAQAIYFNKSYSKKFVAIAVFSPLLLALSGYLIWRTKPWQKIKK